MEPRKFLHRHIENGKGERHVGAETEKKVGEKVNEVLWKFQLNNKKKKKKENVVWENDEEQEFWTERCPLRSFH